VEGFGDGGGARGYEGDVGVGFCPEGDVSGGACDDGDVVGARFADDGRGGFGFGGGEEDVGGGDPGEGFGVGDEALEVDVGLGFLLELCAERAVAQDDEGGLGQVGGGQGQVDSLRGDQPAGEDDDGVGFVLEGAAQLGGFGFDVGLLDGDRGDAGCACEACCEGRVSSLSREARATKRNVASRSSRV
jgi:hypothetical protein